MEKEPNVKAELQPKAVSSSALLDHCGSLYVPAWGCDLHYKVFIKKIDGTQQQIGRNASRSSRQFLEALGTDGKPLPYSSPVHKLQGLHPTIHLKSDEPKTSQSHEETRSVSESETPPTSH